MSILLAILFGLIGGAVSSVGGWFAGAFAVRAFHIPGRDGGDAYFTAAIALLIGALGALVSIVLTLRWRGASLADTLTGTPIAIAGMALVGAMGLGIYWLAHPHPIVTNGLQPTLDFQILPPANAELPEITALPQLQTKENRADGWWDRDLQEVVNGRPVLTGHVELYYRSSWRLVVLRLPNQEDHLFQIRLPGRPLGAKYRRWSDWEPEEFFFTPASNVGQRVAPEKAFRIRYQVVPVGP